MAYLTKSDAHLNATADARKAQENLAKDGRLGWGMTMPWRKKGKARSKRGGRTATPPAVVVATSNDPTPQRNAKEPYGFAQQSHPGGQVSHRGRTFVDTFSKHMSEAEWKAAQLLMADYDAHRVKMICGRTYDGMPHTGGRSEEDGHIPQRQRDAADRFAHAHAHVTRHTPVFWTTLEVTVLGKHIEKLGRPMTAEEYGSRITKYVGASATSAGVTGAKFSLIRWLEGCRDWFLAREKRERLVAEATKYAEEQAAKRRRLPVWSSPAVQSAKGQKASA